MSYCVECGVKLDESLKICPLCHTPVYHPNLLKQTEFIRQPFAEKKGEVEPMLKRDVGALLSIVLGSTSVACFVLNLLVFDHSPWSIPVIGACIMLWILFCPRMFFPKFPFSLNLIVSGISIIIYEYALTFLVNSDHWFYALALPITVLSLILIGIMGLLYHFVSKSLISTALYLFVTAGILSVFIELCVDQYLGEPMRLFWSAIVSSVCLVISIALISILSISRLRIQVRKRLHF